MDRPEVADRLLTGRFLVLCGGSLAYMLALGITWPVVMDMQGSIQSAYKVSGIPLVLILDGNGVVRHRNNGVPSNVHRLLDGLMQ